MKVRVSTAVLFEEHTGKRADELPWAKGATEEITEEKALYLTYGTLEEGMIAFRVEVVE